ncbi:MAG: ribonuclease D [Rhodospirillales bacterium]|nr:ribonuclease D [Alphaproteobacteria bacterium]MBL6947462.1 ribonuclease D [Rhodospirillales bacterium]
MPIITDTDTLTEFCERLKSAEYITVDTEFMREKTYWPILCLVQVAGPDEARAIDALADGIDLTPLFDLMADTSVLKVFHAARQDLEIFFNLAGNLPHPVFDTQVAAMVCGFGDSVGYEALVTQLVNASIDKGSRFTDWTLRPLSERQVDYAMADVTHLRPAYEILAAKLHANGREAWLNEEMAVLENNDTYNGNPNEAFRRIKTRNAKPRMLAILRELAAWRENEAQRRDVPRNRIIRDESLLEVAHHAPKSPEQLARTRGLGDKLAHGNYGQQILDAVKKGLDVPDQDCPQPVLKPNLPRGLGPVMDLLKVLLKMKSEDSEVASKLLASAADIELIAAFGEDADVRALRGWRREVFGDDALKLCNGELSLAVKGKKLKVFPTPDA